MSGLRQILLGFLAVLISGLIIVGALTLSFSERGQEIASAPSQALQSTPTVSQVETQKPIQSSPISSAPSEVFSPTEEATVTQAPTASVAATQTETFTATPAEVTSESQADAFTATPAEPTSVPQVDATTATTVEPTAEIQADTVTATPAESEAIEDYIYRSIFPGVFIEVTHEVSVVVIQEEAEPTPTAAQEVTSIKSESCNTPRGWVAYTVRRSDTLSRLSQMTGVSASRIKKANCLASNKLKAGKTIYLPRVRFTPYVWRPMPQPIQPPMQPPLYYNPPQKHQRVERIQPVVIITMPP